MKQIPSYEITSSNCCSCCGGTSENIFFNADDRENNKTV
jgi:transposase